MKTTIHGKHIIEEYKETLWAIEEIKYKNIFQNNDVHVLKIMTNRIIRIVESIETHKIKTIQHGLHMMIHPDIWANARQQQRTTRRDGDVKQ